MPPAYEDFSKTVNDIFDERDSFGRRQFIKSKFKTAPVMGEPITVTTENKVSDGKLLGKLSAKWKHPSGISVDKLGLDPKGPKIEASYSKLPVAGLTANCMFDCAKNVGSIGCDFENDTVKAVLTADVSKEKIYEKAEASIVIGVEGLQVGGELSFKDDNALPTDYKIGIGYAAPMYFASLSAMEKLQKFSLACMYKPMEKLTLALLGSSKLDFSEDKPNKIEAGAAYKVNSQLDVKGKYLYACEENKKGVNKSHAICGALNYSALKKVNLAAGVEIPISSMTKFSSYKSGLSFTLG